MHKIVRRSPAADSFDSLSADIDHPVLRRIYAARRIDSPAQLDYRTACLLPFDALKGVTEAVDLLETALRRSWRILIVADFDADGATACAVGVRALRMSGAAQVDYLVPDRIKHGYGLSAQIADLAADMRPDLLITVDNGIASIDGVRRCKELGMKVLVTDHHLAGDTLPAADAIVNPNQPGDDFPSKNLAGVGVIFYVMLALRARLRDTGWFVEQGLAAPNLAELLDLVALGTVADVVPLDHNNRILVMQGLKRIRVGACRPGVTALAQVANRTPGVLTASDLAFYLGPRLNAAGRMEHMRYGIDCLLNDDPHTALQQARELDRMNRERREVEADMQTEALHFLHHLEQQRETLPIGLCLFEEHWHQGVIGILASRIKERVHRPVIVFTANEEQPDDLKGSARSVRGVHIRDVLNAVHTRHPDMIRKFGGHAMAAGLTLDRAHYEAFRHAFDTEVRRYLSADQLHGVIYSDGELDAADLSLEFAETLRDLPWGQGFPEPVFDGRFNLLKHSLLKGRHLKMSVEPEQGGTRLDVIAFNTVDTHWPAEVVQVTLAYRLDVNYFRGNKNVQLNAEYVAVD